MKELKSKMGTDIGRAKILLEQGALVAIPTETVYGLAANAFDPEAALRIFEAKRRPSFDPLIVHTHSLEKAAEFLKEIPSEARQLAEAFWPGPLTLLLPKNAKIPDVVTSGLPAVAVRIPRHPLSLQLLEQLDFPLAAPSANPFGYISPTTATHVADQLGDQVPYILDGGPCEVGVESTIIGFEGSKTIVYRLGGMGIEDLAPYCTDIELMPHSSSNPQAPGQLKSHYAPRIPVLIGNLTEMLRKYPKEEVAVLSFRDFYPEVRHITLSPSGDLNEAAQNLFKALRELDKMPVRRILAERVPDYGLGRAINDRLSRAAAS
ncbi:L-threonylcarbamoyladenylate synthase [Nafulsella turpanensis]|uniref:L-threonylcarbamoyladenylate synthase n=1 Tax=Nafulsella turpanensis TaxID=1265690 RepID=UPI0003456FFB|nr:L-threonylcarbamoyladenylate synthase [Nafulsella turpanensis]